DRAGDVLRADGAPGGAGPVLDPPGADGGHREPAARPARPALTPVEVAEAPADSGWFGQRGSIRTSATLSSRGCSWSSPSTTPVSHCTARPSSRSSSTAMLLSNHGPAMLCQRNGAFGTLAERATSLPTGPATA